MDLIADQSTLVALALALIAAGAIIGFLAGLFGVGGGGISVPVFFEIFIALGYPPDVAMPVAVGTSLAVVVPTSILSARGHHAKGTLDMDVLRVWALPICIGVIVGAVIARFASAEVFQAVFVCVASINAAKLISGGKGWQLRESLPGRLALGFWGGVIGLVSAIMGIGGGAVTNLFLTLHGVSIHRAVSTSAGVGVLIAIPGTIGYVFAGLGKDGLPPFSLGFISLAAFLFTIPATLLTTRYGVALAHRLSRRKLELAFGTFLVVVALRFIYALLT